jgi:hypothetical protein
VHDGFDTRSFCCGGERQRMSIVPMHATWSKEGDEVEVVPPCSVECGLYVWHFDE